MLPATRLVFDRQRLVVTGSESVTAAFVVAALRQDGHCLTQVSDMSPAR